MRERDGRTDNAVNHIADISFKCSKCVESPNQANILYDLLPITSKT